MARLLLRGPGPWRSLAMPAHDVPVPTETHVLPRGAWDARLETSDAHPGEAVTLDIRNAYVIRAVVHGGTGLAFHDDVVLLESGGILHARRRLLAEHWIPLEYRRLRASGGLAPRRVRWPVIPIGRLLGRNYFHWLLEHLPSVLRSQEAVPGAVAVLPTRMPGFATDSLSALQVPFEVTDAYVASERVVLIDPPVENWPHPEDLQLLVERARRSLGLDGRSAGSRIYVSRSRGRRSIREEVVVEERLQDAGFKIFHPSGQWTRDIEFFDGAALVIGPHGAGLANAIFAAPGAALIEISTPRFRNPLFRRLAAARSLTYTHVECPDSETAPDGEAADVLNAIKGLGLL